MWKAVLVGVLVGLPLGTTVAGLYVYAHAHDGDPYPRAT